MAGAVKALIRDAVSKGATKIADFNRNRMRSDAPNPYLMGIHEPLPSEETLTDLRVTGAIPAELDGRYIRIGPNPITPPNPGLYHWFMGDGMVHGVRLGQGKALWYGNRWIRSRAVSDALGEPPAPGPHEPPFDIVKPTSLAMRAKPGRWSKRAAARCGSTRTSIQLPMIRLPARSRAAAFLPILILITRPAKCMPSVMLQKI